MKHVLASLIIFLISFNSYSHRGGQDANGGHVNSQTGEYHCHSDTCVLPDNIPVAEDVEDPPDGEPSNSLTIAGSWGITKKWARDVVYEGQDDTFYCGCDYTPSGSSGGSIDETSCSYNGQSQSYSSRAVRLEWEHVVPASIMPARGYECWNDGLPECSKAGRACCEKHDLNARQQIFDLHNLVPSVGQVNALRSNKRYGDIDGEDRNLGSCDFEWNSSLAEPPTDKRGEIARIWLYYVSHHNLQLQPGELETFVQWTNDDPLNNGSSIVIVE